MPMDHPVVMPVLRSMKLGNSVISINRMKMRTKKARMSLAICIPYTVGSLSNFTLMWV